MIHNIISKLIKDLTKLLKDLQRSLNDLEEASSAETSAEYTSAETSA